MMDSRRVIVLLLIWSVLACITFDQAESFTPRTHRRRRSRNQGKEKHFVRSAADKEMVDWVCVLKLFKQNKTKKSFFNTESLLLCLNRGKYFC